MEFYKSTLSHFSRPLDPSAVLHTVDKTALPSRTLHRSIW